MNRDVLGIQRATGRTILFPALATLVCSSLLSCSSLREPHVVRELGWVATEDLGIVFIEGVNPSARILAEGTIEVTVVTTAGCPATRADWDMRVEDVSDEGFVFILPYEYRERCRVSPDRMLHINLFTHTEVIELKMAREVSIRVVSGTGEVFDLEMNLRPP